MMLFIVGCIFIVVGILDMTYSPDEWTYAWLITGLVYVIIGYALGDRK